MAGELCGEGKESLRRVEERLTGTVSRYDWCHCRAPLYPSHSVKGKEKRTKAPLSHPLSVAGQVN